MVKLSYNHILFSTDATVTLSPIASDAEGNNFIVTVNLTTSGGGVLDCPLVVTLLPMADTAIGKT